MLMFCPSLHISMAVRESLCAWQPFIYFLPHYSICDNHLCLFSLMPATL
jgi:hypothetical protein